MLTPYPSPVEQALLDRVEAQMEETMKKYDPSHDAHHGPQYTLYLTCAFRPVAIHGTHSLSFVSFFFSFFFTVRRVRKTALAIARTIDPLPDLLVVEIAALAHDMLDKKYVSADIAADPYSFFLPLLHSSPRTESPDVNRDAISTNNINGSSDSPSHSDLGSNLDLIADGRAHTIARIVDNVSWTTEKKLRAAGQWDAWHQTCVELHCVQDADRLDAIGAFGASRTITSPSSHLILACKKETKQHIPA